MATIQDDVQKLQEDVKKLQGLPEKVENLQKQMEKINTALGQLLAGAKPYQPNDPISTLTVSQYQQLLQDTLGKKAPKSPCAQTASTQVTDLNAVVKTLAAFYTAAILRFYFPCSSMTVPFQQGNCSSKSQQ
jgi:hypothetical protein